RDLNVDANPLRSRAAEICESMRVIHFQPVGPVEDVEHLNTSFSLDARGERNLSLQAHIDVIERIALVGVASTRAYTVGEREPIAVSIKSCIDAKPAGALQTAEQ